jgi:hypothetical protein
MPKTPKQYRKLRGRGATLTHYVKLYLGADHLLQVFSTGFTETYKRFYFRDIQAITIRKTIVGKIVNAVLGAILIAFAAFALSTSDTAALVLGSIAACFAGLLGINLAWGPTCTCYLRTAVQNEKLPSLSRLRRARRVLSHLQPQILAFQGGISDEEIRSRLGGGVPSSEGGLPPVISATG